MKDEGPPLEVLLRRITETPEEFLMTPIAGGRGVVDVLAVLADLARRYGHVPDTDVLADLKVQHPNERGRLSVALLLAWLLADESFQEIARAKDNLLPAVAEVARELAPAPPTAFIQDPDRREEIARLSLARLGYRPAGETEAQALDRLKSISAAERARVIKAARMAEERARAIREALARKAAEESADKYTRE